MQGSSKKDKKPREKSWSTKDDPYTQLQQLLDLVSVAWPASESTRVAFCTRLPFRIRESLKAQAKPGQDEVPLPKWTNVMQKLASLATQDAKIKTGNPELTKLEKLERALADVHRRYAKKANVAAAPKTSRGGPAPSKKPQHWDNDVVTEGEEDAEAFMDFDPGVRGARPPLCSIVFYCAAWQVRRGWF